MAIMLHFVRSFIRQSAVRLYYSSTSKKGLYKRCSGISNVQQFNNRHLHNNSSTSNIIGSPMSDLPAINKNMTMTQFVMENFGTYDDKIALVEGLGGRSISYAQLLDHVTAVSSGLIRRGVKMGDVVTLLASNSIEWVVSFLAVLSVGAVCSTANPMYTPDELAHCITLNNTTLMILSPDLLPLVQQTMEIKKSHIDAIVFGGDAPGCQRLESMYDSDRATFQEELEGLNPVEDTATLPFSSGTTGLPKAVMLTHSNYINNILQITHTDALAYGPDDTFLVPQPFYHLFGQLIVTLSALRQGSRIVILPKFHPEHYLSCMEKYKVTFLHAVPPLMVFLAKYPTIGNYDLTHIQAGFVGAAPISQHTLDEAREKMKIPQANFGQFYGLTETTAISHCNSRNGRFLRGNSVGVPVSNTEMKVIDLDTGEPVGPNIDGEICMRGPNIMKGYFKNKQATTDTVSDGWLHSGDIGYYDEEGHTFITDRLKELIKVKGFQVAPAELESILLKHPSVSDSAVIGIEDKKYGELPRAYVVLKDGQHASEADVQKFVESKVSTYKRLLGGVEFREFIPKTGSGKILRRQLRDDYRQKNG